MNERAAAIFTQRGQDQWKHAEWSGAWHACDCRRARICASMREMANGGAEEEEKPGHIHQQLLLLVGLDNCYTQRSCTTPRQT
jgi:hypothetical protein